MQRQKGDTVSQAQGVNVDTRTKAIAVIERLLSCELALMNVGTEWPDSHDDFAVRDIGARLAAIWPDCLDVAEMHLEGVVSLRIAALFLATDLEYSWPPCERGTAVGKSIDWNCWPFKCEDDLDLAKTKFNNDPLALAREDWRQFASRHRNHVSSLLDGYVRGTANAKQLSTGIHFSPVDESIERILQRYVDRLPTTFASMPEKKRGRVLAVLERCIAFLRSDMPAPRGQHKDPLDVVLALLAGLATFASLMVLSFVLAGTVHSGVLGGVLASVLAILAAGIVGVAFWWLSWVRRARLIARRLECGRLRWWPFANQTEYERAASEQAGKPVA